MYNIPTLYDYINTANSAVEPSTVHCKNTGLNFYFKKYLLQKAISVFEWEGLPSTWAKNYFLYILYCWGFISVVRTDKFGVIPQGCSFRGYNVFYQPTHAIIANPLLSGIIEPRIGDECEIIKLQPTYSGIMDIVSFYADLMSLTAEALGVNLVNSKLSYIFGAQSKAQAESFKEMFDRVGSGEPGVFVDKKLFNDDGTPGWFTFAQDLKNNFIAPELIDTLRSIIVNFERDIGIPNANEEKKERLTSFDLKANTDFSNCELWLDCLREGVDKVNALFGLDISVDWREDIKNGNIIDTGAI